MLVDQVFSAHLVLPDSSYQDITGGILNVDISHGTEVYEGPYQQIDTGLFTIVSRSSTLDPNVNANVVEGAAIEFRDSRNVEAGKSNVFFLGYITDIDVQYQRDDDPIITITGTDVFGLLQRTVVSEDLRLAGLNWVSGLNPGDFGYNGPSLKYLVNTTGWQFNTPIEVNVIEVAASPGAIQPALPYDNYMNYAPAAYLPELGETLLEILNKYTQTNLNYCSVNFRQTPGIIDVYPYAKYNSLFWAPMSDPALEFPTYNFSSDPADGRPYESILLNNGYNRRTKALNISNETRFATGVYPNSTIESDTTTYPPLKNNEDVTQVATSLNTNFATSFVNDDAIESYATNIFQAVNFGGDEIQQITFNNGRKEDIDNDYTYSFSQLNQFIRIKHQLNNNQVIDRFYDIAGIRHNITPDKWEMSFTFKPSQNELAFNYQGQMPTIQMNALTGDSNFNFTATITNFPTETIEKVVWCLNGTNSDVTEQWYYSQDENVIQEPNRYKDGLERNGLTQTWNFDDDGILQGPNFPTGGYGTGEWYVIPYIILKNGWVIAPNVKLTVGTPEVDADFFWTQNLTNNFGQVTFTDDSHNNEIGEPDSYLWNFGDGTTSTLKNPLKTYVPVGSENSYSVSLTVFAYGEQGQKVYNTKTQTVTLAQPTMVPNFTFGASGATVQFINTSTNVGFEEPDAYLWNFGDGTTTTVKNPVKIYSGNENETVTFNVTLTTRNIWEQTASVTKQVTLTPINNTGTFPVQRIKLSSATDAQSQGSARMQPYMFFLKGLTSGTLANELYLKPTTKTNSSNIVWYEADGSLDENNDPLNLTRDPSITPNDQYGLSAAKNNSNPGSFELITDIGSPKFNINQLKLTFRDYELNNANRWSPGINVSVADATGPFYHVGYFKTPEGKVVPEGTGITQLEKTLIPARSLPLKTPYFDWTIVNNRTVTFNSFETAEDYTWLTGDGYTMSGKNPTWTYNSTGAGEQHKFTVQLSVSNGGVVTRTSSATIYLPYLAPYPVRYVRLKQRFYDGATAFETPYIRNFSVWDKNNKLIPTVTPQWGRVVNSFSNEGSGFYTGTSSPTLITNSLLTATTLTQTQLPGSAGIRVRGDTAFNRTEWYALIDFKDTFNNIADFSFEATSPVSTVPTYEVWVTDYLGNDAVIAGNSTYLQVGTITPTGASSTIFKTFGIIRP